MKPLALIVEAMSEARPERSRRRQPGLDSLFGDNLGEMMF